MHHYMSEAGDLQERDMTSLKSMQACNVLWYHRMFLVVPGHVQSLEFDCGRRHLQSL